MEFIRFESSHIRALLEKLDHQSRVAFALACALRTAADQEPTVSFAATARDWAENFALSGSIETTAVQELLARLWECPDLDRDDIASTYYALETALKDSIDSAVFASQRAYEARDTLAQTSLTFSEFTSEIEEQLIQHPLVQVELRSQLTDIEALLVSSSNIGGVIQRARNAALHQQ